MSPSDKNRHCLLFGQIHMFQQNMNSMTTST